MLVSVFGVESSSLNWGVNAVRVIFDVIHSGHYFIPLGSAEELQDSWSKRDNDNVVFYCTRPERRIISAFSKLNMPIIVFAEPFANVVSYLMKEQNLSLFQATQLASLNFSALGDLMVKPEIHLFNRHSAPADAIGALSLLMQYVSPDYTTAQRDEVIRRLYPEFKPEFNISLTNLIHHLVPDAVKADDWYDNPEFALFKPHLKKMSGYEKPLSRQAIKKITWPKDIFLTFEQNTQIGEIDLTGIPRVLIYGPYQFLPIGNWTAKVKITVSGNPSGNELIIDVNDASSQNIISEGKVRLPENGAFLIDINFDVTQSYIPIEIRLILQEAAIHGHLKFYDVNLVRNNSISSQ